MFEVHIYIAVDSASAKVTRKKYGYVLECRSTSKDKTREGFGETIGTYHYAVLSALIEALERMKQSCEITVHSEDTFVLNMLEHHLEQWAAGDFKTAKGRPVSNQEEWKRLWELQKEQMILTAPGKHEYSEWLKAEMEKKKKEEELA